MAKLSLKNTLNFQYRKKKQIIVIKPLLQISQISMEFQRFFFTAYMHVILGTLCEFINPRGSRMLLSERGVLIQISPSRSSRTTVKKPNFKMLNCCNINRQNIFHFHMRCFIYSLMYPFHFKLSTKMSHFPCLIILLDVSGETCFSEISISP